MGCVWGGDQSRWYVAPAREAHPHYLPLEMTQWQQGKVQELWEELGEQRVSPERRLQQVAEIMLDASGCVANSAAVKKQPHGGPALEDPELPEGSPITPDETCLSPGALSSANGVDAAKRRGRSLRIVAFASKLVKPGKLDADGAARIIGCAGGRPELRAQLIWAFSNPLGVGTINRADLGMSMHSIMVRRPNRMQTLREREKETDTSHIRWCELAGFVCSGESVSRERFLQAASLLDWLLDRDGFVNTLGKEEWERWMARCEHRVAQRAESVNSLSTVSTDNDAAWQETVEGIARTPPQTRHRDPEMTLQISPDGLVVKAKKARRDQPRNGNTDRGHGTGAGGAQLRSREPVPSGSKVVVPGKPIHTPEGPARSRRVWDDSATGQISPCSDGQDADCPREQACSVPVQSMVMAPLLFKPQSERQKAKKRTDTTPTREGGSTPTREQPGSTPRREQSTLLPTPEGTFHRQTSALEIAASQNGKTPTFQSTFFTDAPSSSTAPTGLTGAHRQRQHCSKLKIVYDTPGSQNPYAKQSSTVSAGSATPASDDFPAVNITDAGGVRLQNSGRGVLYRLPRAAASEADN
eukprot:TRINITY_DN64819_c0_g1_i1.p1 TRINITY_DN64819_c0_g1~~TRINITY_DN64819_c0_g1_i1.p1  ORF type:complete len:584 (+),score=142.38 TRINITY_DN64819_c0_g1_i1:173-1924(+)